MASQVEYENHLHDTIPRWFAIYTRYKREKLVHKFLERKGIKSYLPINNVIRRWDRKVRSVELPLINCYVFVNITKSEYINVLDTENVLNFVRFSKNLISIPSEEIDLMRRVTGEFKNIELMEEQMKKGDNVEIIGGNLTGMKGQLVEKDNKKKFVIELNNLGYSLMIEVNPNLLRKSI